MREADVEKQFYQQAKTLVKKMGNHPLSNFELDKKGYELFKNKYLGTFSQDTIPFKNGFYIFNVDIQSKGGSHWVACYQTRHTLYIFDSFGRRTSTLLPILTRQAKRLGLKLVMSDPDKNQTDTSVICGHLCLAYLICVKKLGIRDALKI